MHTYYNYMITFLYFYNYNIYNGDRYCDILRVLLSFKQSIYVILVDKYTDGQLAAYTSDRPAVGM